MIEEYKSLRRELAQHAASISRWHLVGLLVAGIGSVAIIYNTDGQAVEQIAFLVGTLVVLSGCIFGITHDLTSILRVAAYIQTFHEGEETGALWETRLEKTRGADVFVPLRGYMTPIPSLWWAGFIVSVIPLVIYVILAWLAQAILGHADGYSSMPKTTLVAPLVWIIFWLFIRKSFKAFGGAFKEQTLKAFAEISTDSK
jgi:hypothetical protein